MSKYTDDELLLSRLRSQDETWIRKIYDQFETGFIRGMTSIPGCEKTIAREIYSEAFSIMYFNILKERLAPPLRSSLMTYLTAIGKHLLFRRTNLKYDKITVSLDTQEDLFSDELVNDTLEKENQGIRLLELLNKIGEPCKKLLHLFYYKELSFRDISEILKEEEGRLRKRKFDCLKKLHQLIQKSRQEWEI